MVTRRTYSKAFKIEAVRLLGLGEKPASQESEVARLKRDLEQVREERDILKKAAAYFARELP